MAKDTATSTQEHLPIAGIQDGVIIMNDASIKCVLKIEPINFELKSETEQNAIIYSYQAFLNSLEFPIQIVIHSKKLDLERYLMKLDETKKNVSNDLLRIQIEDYVEFVRRLISIANIMSKHFYVVVSYAAVTRQSGLASLTSIFNHQPKGPLLFQDQFERFRTEVLNRGTIIANGLSRLGLKVSFLETQQLLELFYSIYNPDVATEERLTDIENLKAGVVSSQGALPPQAAEAVDAAAGVKEETMPTVPLPQKPEMPVTPPVPALDTAPGGPASPPITPTGAANPTAPTNPPTSQP